jgi:hypothetical protein
MRASLSLLIVVVDRQDQNDIMISMYADARIGQCGMQGSSGDEQGKVTSLNARSNHNRLYLGLVC